VNTFTVEFKADNRDMLEEALKATGLNYTRYGSRFTVYSSGGTINLGEGTEASLRGNNTRGLTADLNAIKRAYSGQILQKAAKKNRWVTKFTDEKKTKGLFLRG
jgi:hypothetical protein